MTDILTLTDFWSCYIYDDDICIYTISYKNNTLREENAYIRTILDTEYS